MKKKKLLYKKPQLTIHGKLNKITAGWQVHYHQKIKDIINVNHYNHF